MNWARTSVRSEFVEVHNLYALKAWTAYRLAAGIQSSGSAGAELEDFEETISAQKGRMVTALYSQAFLGAPLVKITNERVQLRVLLIDSKCGYKVIWRMC